MERIEDEEVKNFILWCLTRATERPSAKDLLESPFLNDLESEKNNHEVQVTPLVKEKKKKFKKRELNVMKQRGSTILEEEEENSEADIEPAKLSKEPSHNTPEEVKE